MKTSKLVLLDSEHATCAGPVKFGKDDGTLVLTNLRLHFTPRRGKATLDIPLPEVQKVNRLTDVPGFVALTRTGQRYLFRTSPGAKWYDNVLAAGNTQEMKNLRSQQPAVAPPTTAVGTPAKRDNSKAVGCLTVIVLAVIVVVLAVVLGGSSSGTTYRVQVVSVIPTNSQELAVVWKVTNTGNHPDKPECTIYANSPGDADSGLDDVTAANNLSPGQFAIYHDVFTITNNGANNVQPSGVKVSCS